MDTGKSQFDSPNAGVLGEPDVLPQVGKEYQVDIPSYKQHWTDGDDSCWDLFVGLHIPLRWANLGGKRNKKGSAHAPESSPDIILEDGKITNLSVGEKQPKGECSGPCLVPDDILDSWTNFEKSSFLLGLYVFERDFAHLKTFVQTKKTSDILSYYYGEFYGSDEHRRWSDGRKVRGRKCVYGQRLFIGSRLQELISRLVPHISAECQNELLEMSKTFGEGKLRLDEYVFSLKRMVGMNALIEAVGIGKGKQDLTNMALEHTRSNHAFTMRPEVPAGKACSSLTPTEIIKYLTGGYRLSKTRSNDLFWEAVWPRLLARGWHSEQPKNMAYAAGSSKQSLVFLMPDVKKFSRKLIKGNHYFDSVTDVLSKVASEPKLLYLDTEDQDGDKNQEQEGEGHDGAKADTDDLCMTKSHSYLQPRTPTQYTDDMKFTVVDTSLCDAKPYRVRDLRSLPLEISSKLFEDGGKDSQKVSADIPGSVDTMLLDQTEPICAGSNASLPSGETSSDRKDLEIGTTKRKTSPHSRNKKVLASCSMNSEDLCDDAKSKKVAKPSTSHKVKKQNVDNIGPISKRPRGLSACNRTETKSINCVSKVEVGMPSHSASNALKMGSFQDKMSSTISSKSIPSVSIDHVPVNINSVAEVSPEEHQPRISIDLNVLPVSPDSEGGLSVTDITEEQTDSLKKPETHCNLPVLSGMDTSEEQQPATINSRRHSTRNRPPTTRALEALANGFLTVNRRPKTKEAGSQQNLGSKSSQEAHDRTKTAGFADNSEVSEMEEETNDVCNMAKNGVFTKFQPPPNGNGGTIAGL